MSEDEFKKYHHFKIKTSDGIELDLIETKYYEELLDLYKQEKEWNQKIIKAEKFYRELYNDVVKKTNERYIPKDKIRAKIKELEEKSDYWNCDEIEVLKGLLEEN
jgi:hypothetical protein